mmetsp:Transcript_20308/g.56479  ORF Transcript_20308/g.56479 Transcript_20308/m.56479 type:complete len:228 (+) Transcript_20308:235-918(+)
MSSAIGAPKDGNDGIDEEMVDLFAIMNSSIVELQIEMDRLECKEYRDGANARDNGSHSHSDEGSGNGNGNGNDEQQIQREQEQEQEKRLVDGESLSSVLSPKNPMPDDDDAVEVCAEEEDEERQDELVEAMMPSLEDYENATDQQRQHHAASASASASLPTPAQWDKVEPSTSGDSDYVPVTSPSAIHWDKLEPARRGDSDYVPVADYTPTATLLKRLNAAVRSWLQ